ncbi:MAG TPA: sialate O-acetylesterase [Pedobacter sp.]|jgi:sialate O-acetylesterase
MKNTYALLIFLCLFISAKANVIMPGIFGNDMVLQRNKPIPVWGWAKANEAIRVSLNKQIKTVRADKSGNWMVELSPENAGGPFSLTVRGNNAITFSDVLIGEVWICSGQSNMEWPLTLVNNADLEISEANYPQIRHFAVTKDVSIMPKKDIAGGSWQKAEPKNAGNFSAVAYFFARKLHQELKVPIGLINASWGGTHVETWTSNKAFHGSEEFKSMIASIPLSSLDSLDKAKSAKRIMDRKRWKSEILTANLLSSWNKPDFDDSKWNKLNAPGMWEDQGIEGVDGVLLFRKSFNLDASDAGKAAVLELAKIDDDDITYINGIEVGRTDGYNFPRKYMVPAGIVKAGNNVVAVRLKDTKGGGGFYGELPMQITVNGHVQPLSGEWLYSFEAISEISPVYNFHPNEYPSLLHNAMVHPLIPFAIQGVIWYQGENNASRAWQYRTAFPLMITDWRKQWKQGDFPFYFVQLASYDAGGSGDKNLGYHWAELREAQTLTLSLPNTGMAVTSDIGEAKDVHPRNKQDVGLRLALAALSNTYKKNVVGSGPMYQSMKTERNKVIISFSNMGTGLMTKDEYGYLKGFEIAGTDQKYYYAKAYIKGDKVIVYSDDIPNPVAVRFGWYDEISDNNLFNKEGLPAVPFRTDNWEWVTAANKFKAGYK